MAKPKYWWVAHTFDGSEFCHSAEQPDWADSWYGPFASLSAAKNDALRYHRATKDTANAAIHKIKQVREKDFTDEEN